MLRLALSGSVVRIFVQVRAYAEQMPSLSGFETPGDANGAGPRKEPLKDR